MRVALVHTETSNLASVKASLHRLGLDHVDVVSADQLRGAQAVLLPGVGAFAPAVGRLRERGLLDALRRLLQASAGGEGPFAAGICLGFQLLAAESEEGGKAKGLAVHDERIEALSEAPRWPHIGWNDVAYEGTPASGEAYYAHSFGLRRAPSGWRQAWCDHGDGFVAALHRGRLSGAQFHPELSGSWGQAWLARALGLFGASENQGTNRVRPPRAWSP